MKVVSSKSKPNSEKRMNLHSQYESLQPAVMAGGLDITKEDSLDFGSEPGRILADGMIPAMGEVKSSGKVIISADGSAADVRCAAILAKSLTGA